MCVLSIKVLIRKKSGILLNDPRTYFVAKILVSLDIPNLAHLFVAVQKSKKMDIRFFASNKKYKSEYLTTIAKFYPLENSRLAYKSAIKNEY